MSSTPQAAADASGPASHTLFQALDRAARILEQPPAPALAGQTVAPYWETDDVTLLLGDALNVLRTLPARSVDCIVTSPPYYGLRDYGTPGQYGLEPTPAAYVEQMRALFAEARRVLANDGTLWLNLGDSYARGNNGQGNNGPSSTLQGGTRPSFREDGATVSPTMRAGGIPEKNLLMLPERTAIALQDEGWILRSKVIWHKTNAMPESVKDRPANRYEHLFLFAKKPRYWFDLDAIREPCSPASMASTERRALAQSAYRDGRHGHRPQTLAATATARGANPGDVWSIPTRPYPAAHFAVFPIDLPIRCIKAGCRPGGTVLDPFSGSGTTGAAARALGRKYVGVDLNPAYHDLAKKRFAQSVLDLDFTDQDAS